jgi:hypothetical protein
VFSKTRTTFFIKLYSRSQRPLLPNTDDVNKMCFRCQLIICHHAGRHNVIQMYGRRLRIPGSRDGKWCRRKVPRGPSAWSDQRGSKSCGCVRATDDSYGLEPGPRMADCINVRSSHLFLYMKFVTEIPQELAGISLITCTLQLDKFIWNLGWESTRNVVGWT